MGDKLDSSIDPTSEDFDPELALYAEVELPNVKIYNNVETMMATLNRGERPKPKPKPPDKKPSKDEIKATQEFLQLTHKPARQPRLRTLLSRIEATGGYKGPMACLVTYMKQHRRVKVWTRNFDSIRGNCTGFLVLFDKYWNLVLSDVEEVYWMPHHRKGLVTGMDQLSLTEGCHVKLGKNHQNVQQKNKDVVLRHIPQLLIRGDNVVMVRPLPV